MFDEEESKSPLNPQQWYEATNAKNALHPDPTEVMEQIHRTALLQKINTVRQAIIASPLDISPNGLSPNLCLQSLAGLREQLEEGAQPRKRTLLILNKWWREFKQIS